MFHGERRVPSLNIVACIKQVPGTSEVDVDENGSLVRDNVEAKMNPFDLFTIEAAMRLKERHGGAVHVISMGPPQAEAVIREAFMMGADTGALLTDRRFAGSDVLATAFTLSQGIKRVPFDLVICGKQTTDGDTAQVGPEIAEFLGIPHVTNVRSIVEVRDRAIVVEADLPDAIQVVEVAFPCLITVEKDIHQPRLPSFKRKLATASRTIDRVALLDLDEKDDIHYGLKGSPTRVQRVFPPPAGATRETWRDEPGTLAARLHARLREARLL